MSCVRSRGARWGWGCALGLSLLGCSFASKGEALAVRWFDPETARPRVTSGSVDGTTSAPFTLELRSVTSGASLRERIAYRDAAFEMGFYDDKRWTERPETYVRRALARTLFEEHGIRRAVAGRALALDVEVVAFEELRGPPRAARIELWVLVHDDARVLLEKTVTVDRPVEQGAVGFDGFVQAMSQALDAVSELVARDTEAVLRTDVATRR